MGVPDEAERAGGGAPAEAVVNQAAIDLLRRLPGGVGAAGQGPRDGEAGWATSAAETRVGLANAGLCAPGRACSPTPPGHLVGTTLTPAPTPRLQA